MVVNEDFFRFVEQNKNQDPCKLRLKYHGCEMPWADMAITHIECLKKCGKKFGVYRPELMTSPLSVEQATSEAVARLHGDIARQLVPDARCILDMTCGMGIDLRAIVESLHCNAIGIELNKSGAETAAYNFRNNQKVEIINGDSVEWLRLYEGERFDLIFIDPARRGDNGERVYNIHDCRPDISELVADFSSKCRYVMAKLSPMLDITQTLRDLPATRRLYVVEEGGECRELLVLLDFVSMPERAEIVVLDTAGRRYAFSQEEERVALEQYENPQRGLYLFEPGAAMMKGAPFALLCERQGLKKLHRNTNLFVSERIVEDLPGRWYYIEDVAVMSSASLKELGRRVLRADVAVRNYPMRAEDLHKKLKMKAGGNHRLICCMAGDAAMHSDRGVVVVLNKQLP